MKPVAIVAFLVLGLGCLGAAMWLGNQAAPSASSAGKTGAPAAAPPPVAAAPKIASTGPYPKAVAPELEYDFGTMMHGAKSSHAYVIRNEGEAPLELTVGIITCNCTGAKIATEEPIPPGGETTVTVSWEVKNPNPNFRHSAQINTNDPQQPKIELVIKGTIEPGLQYDPPGNQWDLGEVVDQTVVESQKLVYSNAVDQFKILEVTPSSPRITCSFEPMDAAALEKVKAKCGYVLKLTADAAELTGNLNERVKVITDMENDVAPDLLVKLRKQGPIELIARHWNSESGRLFLGEFPAAQGKQVEISVLARVEEDIKLVAAESEHNAVKVAWEKDERFASKSGKLQRYRLKVEIPPGASAVQRQRDQAEKLDLKFDHPKIGTLKIWVDYLST